MAVKEDIADIKSHISTLNDEYGNIKDNVNCLKTDLAVVKNDIKWLKTWGIGILVLIQIVVSVVITKIL